MPLSNAETIVLTAQAAAALIATGERIGHAHCVASGKFIAGYRLPSGDHVDHYLNFGWSDKFIFVPAGYVEPETKFQARFR